MSTLVHILRASGHYVGQVRRRGARRWETVTGKRATAERALAGAVLEMKDCHNRARALFIDASGWYEPHVAMEAKR